MFDLDFSLYPYVLLFSLILNIIFVLLLARKYKLKIEEAVVGLLYENIGFLFGCKIHASLLNSTFLTFDNFYNVGFSSLGGLFLAMINLVIFSIQFKIDLKKVLYVFIPVTPLLYSIGKIACFIEGCCYGIPYSGVFAITYLYNNEAPNTSVFPIQLVESIVFLLIFIWMYSKSIKRKQDLRSLGYGFILMGLAKYMLDFLRSSHINIVISKNQYLCFIFFIIGIICMYKDKDVNKNDK